MNEKSALLGLKESQFKNSHGMPADDQYTTAMDVAFLARRYIEDHPEALVYHPPRSLNIIRLGWEIGTPFSGKISEWMD
jgi:D-alanyl-D-alanine carboxypeptidase (penicillin-binding protein 5/6)